MSKTARQLTLRLEKDMADRLAAFEKKTHVDGVTIGFNALEAALNYYEKHGHITFPFTLVPAESLAEKTPGKKS